MRLLCPWNRTDRQTLCEWRTRRPNQIRPAIFFQNFLEKRNHCVFTSNTEEVSQSAAAGPSGTGNFEGQAKSNLTISFPPNIWPHADSIDPRAACSLSFPSMQKIISAAQMREIDRLTTERYAVPSLLLMEAAADHAARAIAAHFAHNVRGKRVSILCGPGNNGGDGAALARVLWMMNARPRVVLFARVEDTHGDARTNFKIARHLAHVEDGVEAVPVPGQFPLSFATCDTIPAWERMAEDCFNCEVIVDALFGTGLVRPLEGVHRSAVEHLLRLRERRRADQHGGGAYPLILSLDVPSGLNADKAEPIGAAVHADLTVTFTAPKPANVLPPATHLNGRLVVAPVGSPPALLAAASSQLYVTERTDALGWLTQTRYTHASYKNVHGHVLVIAGSRQYTGAAVLCGDAAMRSGAGLTTVATPSSALPAVAARVMPEVMTAALAETDQGAASAEAIEDVRRLAGRATIVAIGPGLASDDESTRSFVRAVVEGRRTPVVIDADGLNALAPWPADLRGSHQAPLILTPHAGEMLRLMGASDRTALADRVGAARHFATTHKVILVLKGSRSLLAAPDERVFVNPTGNAGLGTAGAGDTLTGIIAGFNAQAFAMLEDKADAVAATLAALYVGGTAGDIAARSGGMRAMIASDIREHLGVAISELDPEGERP